MTSSVPQNIVKSLVLLDLRSAFDFVIAPLIRRHTRFCAHYKSFTLHYINHEIMIQLLTERFQVEGQALVWFISYFGDRSQIFKVDGCDSVPFPVNCSVP